MARNNTKKWLEKQQQGRYKVLFGILTAPPAHPEGLGQESTLLRVTMYLLMKIQSLDGQNTGVL